jgi:hypothetical protein
MINVNAATYEISAIIRPIVLPHECRCLFLSDKIKNYCLYRTIHTYQLHYA